MKKSLIYLVICVFTAISLLSSCSSIPDSAQYIPTDAAMVGVVDLVSIGQKGKIQDAKSLHMYKNALELMQNSNENTATLFESLVEDPSKTGVDLMKDMFLYFYPIRENEKGFVCISLELDDMSKFKDNMEELLSDDYDLIEDENYTYYSNENNSWIAFNSETAVFISSIDAKNEEAEEFIQRIFSLDKTEKLSENSEFKEFYDAKKDISFWIASTSIIDVFSTSLKEDFKKTLEQYDGLTLEDLENNYVHIFLNFEADAITCDFSLKPNEAFKKYLESTDFSKDKLNEEMYQFFPQKTYFLAMYGFEPKKLNEYLQNIKTYQSFQTEMQQQDINPTDIINAMGGDIMFSLYDIQVKSTEEKTKMLRLTPAGQYEYVDTVFINETILPKASLILSLKNSEVIQSVISKIITPDMYTKVKNYMDFTKTLGFPLYAGINSDNLMITTDEKSIQNLYGEGFQENFSNAEMVQDIEGSSYYYLNLNFDTYPEQIKNYVNKIGIQSMIAPYTSAFESLVITNTDDYSGQLKITMKDDSENSLYQVLQLVDSNFKNQ